MSNFSQKLPLISEQLCLAAAAAAHTQTRRMNSRGRSPLSSSCPTAAAATAAGPAHSSPILKGQKREMVLSKNFPMKNR
jgi:hypothetical protein